MSNNSRTAEATIWRTGYVFALLLLMLFGVSLIVMGAAIFQQGSLPNVILVGAGISMAPAAVVAVLFRTFLFKEVQYQLTQPVINEVKERLGPEMQKQVEQTIKQYRNEITTLRALKDAGVICPNRRRELALREFASAIDAETTEIAIIGSSLKGLLQMEKYKEIADKLRFKIDRGGVRIKFLLTHPVVADLRARQEGREFTEIGSEILDTLQELKEWNVPPVDVRLYKGTPTCFAIKAAGRMLINPYPYGAVSYDSPCLIVETSDDHPSYFFDEFEKSHFGAWDTDVAAKIFNYDETIRELRDKLDNYAQMIRELLRQ